MWLNRFFLLKTFQFPTLFSPRPKKSHQEKLVKKAKEAFLMLSVARSGGGGKPQTASENVFQIHTFGLLCSSLSCLPKGWQRKQGSGRICKTDCRSRRWWGSHSGLLDMTSFSAFRKNQQKKPHLYYCMLLQAMVVGKPQQAFKSCFFYFNLRLLHC